MDIKELLSKVYDKLADNRFNGIEIFDFEDLDYGYIDTAKNEIVLVKDDFEYVLTMTKRPYTE